MRPGIKKISEQWYSSWKASVIISWMISEDTFEFSVAKGQKLKFNFWISNDELKYLSVTDDHQTRPWNNTWLSLNNDNGKNKMPVKLT